MTWQTYDPTWLVSLAREQLPEYPWLPDALARCTTARIESEAYIHFVDPTTRDWRLDTNLKLTSPTEGWIVLDVLTTTLGDYRIGGVEFVDKIKVET